MTDVRSPATSRSPAKVIVVGAINIDYVVSASRLPGPGETVVGAGVERFGGGKGANAAVAAARAGAVVRLIGAVGADDAGTSTLADLQLQGVSTDDVQVLDDVPTGVALIVVDPKGENQIAVGAGANSVLSPERVRSSLTGAGGTTDCVLVSTEVAGEAVVAAVEVASGAGVRCVLNPAPPIREVVDLLVHGPILTPNASEVLELAAMLGSEESCEIRGRPLIDDVPVSAPLTYEGPSGYDDEMRAGWRLMARTGAPVVITLGAGGVLVLTTDGQAQHVQAPTVSVRDTTGAGDTFNGVLALRLAAGDPLEFAAHVAATAASLSVSHVGARDGMPDAATIDAAMRTA